MKKYRNLAIILCVLAIFSGCSQTETITIEVPASNDDVLVENLLNMDDTTENKDATVDTATIIPTVTTNPPDIVQKPAETSPKKPVTTPMPEEDIVNNAVESTQTVTVEIPSRLTHDVAFAAQAPFGNWNLPYKEACEEASLIMVDHYFSNTPLNNDIMDKEILDIVDWQKEKFGYYEDTNTTEMLIMAQEYFGLNAHIVYNPTINQLKKELADGNLIIVPAAGQQLPNPHFRAPGPPYHVLVLTGYDSDEFISNDPGTRHGEDFKYKYDDLMRAIHDYNGGDILNGGSMVIVVEG